MGLNMQRPEKDWLGREQFIAELGQAIAQRVESTLHTCLNCEHFSEKTELCGLYNARPPARVIANGCPSHEWAIPF